MLIRAIIRIILSFLDPKGNSCNTVLEFGSSLKLTKHSDLPLKQQWLLLKKFSGKDIAIACKARRKLKVVSSKH